MTDEITPMPNVQLGYLHSADNSHSFTHSLMRLIARDLRMSRRLKGWSEIQTGPMSLPESRNDLCRQTLADPNIEWLFMLDTDMGFEDDTLDRLLAVAHPDHHPVVGALCFAQRNLGPDGRGGFNTYLSPTILQWTKGLDGFVQAVGVQHYPVNFLVRAGATGAACLLIHRSVLARIESELGPVWFDRVRDPAGQLQGEDVSFCERMKNLGISLYIDTGVRCTHAKTEWLSEPDFWMRKLAPPATERVEVIVPVLHRPQNVPTLMRSLRASTGLARAWYVCEPRDAEMAHIARSEGAEVIWHEGTFSQKVNAAYRKLRKRSDCAPWIMLAGDDVCFRPAWLDHALDVARRYKASVVGTNDMLNPRVVAGEHATHMLIRREYIDRTGASWDGPGIVCHEGYRHWFVDDEIVTAARVRHVFQAALGSYVEHLHPYAGKAAHDDIYALGEAHAEEDRVTWEHRLDMNTRDEEIAS